MIKKISFQKGIDLIRITLGILFIYKAITFIFEPLALQQWMSDGQLLVKETLISHYVIISHLCGGVLLVIGLLTRLSALLQVPILLGAIVLIQNQEGIISTQQNLEFSILVLLLTIVISLTGSGNISFDHFVKEDINY